jgi:lysozyme
MVAAFGHAQSYYIQCEDTCGHVHGIDMSHYQTKIFWDEVGDNNRIHYLYLKASEGSDNIDKRYQENIRMAQSHNIKVGSYHFYRPLRPQMEQLRNFRAQCRPEDQDLIPMIDVETKSGMRTEAFVDSLQKFLKLIEREYHQKPLVYTGQNFYNSYLVGALDGYKLMIAKYSDTEPVLSDDRDIFAWQYTGKGHLTGVNGYVDKSRLMGRHALREIRFHK